MAKLLLFPVDARLLVYSAMRRHTFTELLRYCIQSCLDLTFTSSLPNTMALVRTRCEYEQWTIVHRRQALGSSVSFVLTRQRSFLSIFV